MEVELEHAAMNHELLVSQLQNTMSKEGLNTKPQGDILIEQAESPRFVGLSAKENAK
jgi:hypothetical protein